MLKNDTCRYFSRLQTMRQLTHYADGYNLYLMDILYDYSLEELLDYGITNDETMVEAILSQALPGLPVRIQPPHFGCSAFCTADIDGEILMGRNYDFRRDTSCMLVHCAPVEGYASVGFAALDNVNANDPMQTMEKRLAALTAPFICLDGMNEKGLSVAVLTLDSAPVFQQTGKPVITPPWRSGWCWTGQPTCRRRWGCCRAMICLLPVAGIIIFILRTRPGRAVWWSMTATGQTGRWWRRRCAQLQIFTRCTVTGCCRISETAFTVTGGSGMTGSSGFWRKMPGRSATGRRGRRCGRPVSCRIPRM